MVFCMHTAKLVRDCYCCDIPLVAPTITGMPTQMLARLLEASSSTRTFAYWVAIMLMFIFSTVSGINNVNCLNREKYQHTITTIQLCVATPHSVIMSFFYFLLPTLISSEPAVVSALDWKLQRWYFHSHSTFWGSTLWPDLQESQLSYH